MNHAEIKVDILSLELCFYFIMQTNNYNPVSAVATDVGYTFDQPVAGEHSCNSGNV